MLNLNKIKDKIEKYLTDKKILDQNEKEVISGYRKNGRQLVILENRKTRK